MTLVIRLQRQELADLLSLQACRRKDWDAVFSTNRHSSIWPFVTRGWTPLDRRKEVQGLSQILDKIRKEYLRIRPRGGRLFVNKRGAFWKGRAGQTTPIATFKFVSQRRPEQLSAEEAESLIREARDLLGES